MRALATVLSLCLFGPLAFADDGGPEPGWAASAAVRSAPALAPVALEDLPQRCRSIAKRTVAPSASQALSARIALAGCIADARLAPLSLIDGQESVLAIDAAVVPAFRLLDGVVDAGDVSMKVVALRTKASLYAQMCTRMMNTVPPPTDTSPEAAALRETRREIVDGMTQDWRGRALEAHQAVVDLGRAHPELQRNPVVQAAIRDSERQLAEAFASS
jgi:hypothetical protein